MCYVCLSHFETNDKGMPKVKRYIVTDEVSGWHGKTRDPMNVLKPYEQVDDVTALLREWLKQRSRI